MRMGKRLYSLIMFLFVAFLGGLLAAGLIVPIAGIASTAGTSVASSLDQLPAELETPPQPERSRLLTANGKVLATFYDENRIYVPLDKISPLMRQAQVAIEDHRFYEHGALDLQGTLRALVSTSQGNTQGASTLTQQYVRLVLVENAEEISDEAQKKAAKDAATENTLGRKIRELRYAIAIEQKFSKDEILERYLNMSYYGDGAYGVEAAAKHYFNTSAAKLTLAESAMLAGLVRNPVSTNPVKYPQQGISRRNDVLTRMYSLGEITASQLAEAKAEPFDASKVKKSLSGCANSKYPFVCDYAYRTLLTMPALGDTTEERENLVKRGGLTIQTLIDTDAQDKAQSVISNYIDARDPVISVITMLQPGTGLIKAMAQSRPVMGINKDAKGKDKWKGETYYNYAATADMGGAEGFQAGSTFKIFTAAAALDEGLGSYDKIKIDYEHNYKGETFKSCDGTFDQPSNWRVTGGAGQVGRFDMWAGAKHSMNNYFARLIQRVGICPVVKMASKLGLKSADGQDLVKAYSSIPSFTLGVAGISPLSLTEAYATFAARGIHCDPIILKSITNRDGQDVPVPSANCKRVISEDLADAINAVFQGPYNGGTATPARVWSVKMAGKTGTVPNNKAIWTMGYTPDLAAAAMISYDSQPKWGFPKFWESRNNRFLRYVYLKYSKRTLSGASGQEAGGRLLKPAFAAALADIPDKHQFVAPPKDILVGEKVSVPSCSGLGLAACKARLLNAGFTPVEEKQYSEYPAGTLIGTSASGGSATKASTITLYVSKGPEPLPPTPTTPTPTPGGAALPPSGGTGPQRPRFGG
jgi:membrane peptidoglycan carboxypeptidase